MGNSSTKESRPSSSLGHGRPSSRRNAASPTTSGPPGAPSHPSGERLAPPVYASQSGRRSRPDLSFLGLGNSNDRDPPPVETRRETKAEREARRLERERAAREKERERSLREEGVDGGYLVTLGTYIGPEDFSKPVVRQLMIERRLAPFWRGLNDHSDSWKEHQLVAAAKGLPIPGPDEIPPEEPERSSSRAESNPRSSDLNINHLTVPITSRSQSATSERSMNLSPSHPAFSLPPPSSPIAASPSSPFFRSRAKTLASLTTSSRNNSQTEMTPQEIRLPDDPTVNGQKLEVFLYKDASECPVCFLYYPPYLNKTRCCDQPICSYCFVQIKRPDPHPPEHHDDAGNPTPQDQPEDNQLVSEPSKCPYCTQSEFGVTYEPPPFRRGLVHATTSSHHHPVAKASSAMSSSTSLNSQGMPSPGGSRRRTTSLSVNAPEVISTDKIRPDWAKKLADARAHALRRAAAATALHNAAYVLGNVSLSDSRGFGLGRRRRNMFGSDSPNSSGRGTPRQQDPAAAGATLPVPDRQGGTSGVGPGAAEREGQGDLYPGRHSSRRSRMEDLEELMVMEAIRLSLAAEEERKRKEEKEAAKEAKKEEKRKAKEAKEMKKAEKSARRGTLMIGTDSDGARSRSSVNILAGKGKAVDRPADAPTSEPLPPLTLSTDDPQRHLEESRAQLQSHVPDSPFGPAVFSALGEASHRSMLRQISHDNSSASSIADSLPGSLKSGNAFASFEPSPSASGLSIPGSAQESGSSAVQSEVPSPGTEPMFNFQSLAEVIDDEGKKDESPAPAEHIEDVVEPPKEATHSEPAETQPTPEEKHDTTEISEDFGESSRQLHSSSYSTAETLNEPSEASNDTGESSKDTPPPDYLEANDSGLEASVATVRPPDTNQADDKIEPVVEHVQTNGSNQYDKKHYGDVNILDSHPQEATQ